MITVTISCDICHKVGGTVNKESVCKDELELEFAAVGWEFGDDIAICPECVEREKGKQNESTDNSK